MSDSSSSSSSSSGSSSGDSSPENSPLLGNARENGDLSTQMSMPATQLSGIVMDMTGGQTGAQVEMTAGVAPKATRAPFSPPPLTAAPKKSALKTGMPGMPKQQQSLYVIPPNNGINNAKNQVGLETIGGGSDSDSDDSSSEDSSSDSDGVDEATPTNQLGGPIQISAIAQKKQSIVAGMNRRSTMMGGGMSNGMGGMNGGVMAPMAPIPGAMGITPGVMAPMAPMVTPGVMAPMAPMAPMPPPMGAPSQAMLNAQQAQLMQSTRRERKSVAEEVGKVLSQFVDAGRKSPKSKKSKKSSSKSPSKKKKKKSSSEKKKSSRKSRRSTSSSSSDSSSSDSSSDSSSSSSSDSSVDVKTRRKELKSQIKDLQERRRKSMAVGANLGAQGEALQGEEKSPVGTNPTYSVGSSHKNSSGGKSGARSSAGKGGADAAKKGLIPSLRDSMFQSGSPTASVPVAHPANWGGVKGGEAAGGNAADAAGQGTTAGQGGTAGQETTADNDWGQGHWAADGNWVVTSRQQIGMPSRPPTGPPTEAGPTGYAAPDVGAYHAPDVGAQYGTTGTAGGAVAFDIENNQNGAAGTTGTATGTAAGGTTGTTGNDWAGWTTNEWNNWDGGDWNAAGQNNAGTNAGQNTTGRTPEPQQHQSSRRSNNLAGGRRPTQAGVGGKGGNGNARAGGNGRDIISEYPAGYDVYPDEYVDPRKGTYRKGKGRRSAGKGGARGKGRNMAGKGGKGGKGKGKNGRYLPGPRGEDLEETHCDRHGVAYMLMILFLIVVGVILAIGPHWVGIPKTAWQSVISSLRPKDENTGQQEE